MDGAGGEELADQDLGAVSGEGVEGGVRGCAPVGEEGGCWGKRIGVVGEQVGEVEGVGVGFRDYYGSVEHVSILCVRTRGRERDSRTISLVSRSWASAEMGEVHRPSSCQWLFQ